MSRFLAISFISICPWLGETLANYARLPGAPSPFRSFPSHPNQLVFFRFDTTWTAQLKPNCRFTGANRAPELVGVSSRCLPIPPSVSFLVVPAHASYGRYTFRYGPGRSWCFIRNHHLYFFALFSKFFLWLDLGHIFLLLDLELCKYWTKCQSLDMFHPLRSARIYVSMLFFKCIFNCF